ncbi:SE1561 family protein [Salsuginibacillus kocurii]|uniref:SE1561 family protein n=1 Tax=Salsuginibacillus kocurii TaxID=427078 RepID=UPI000362FF18|nr:SE1561 family protein [Salsuginibacillus kocurii]
MGAPVRDKERQLDYLRKRAAMLKGMLDHMDAEAASAKELEYVQKQVGQIETKIGQFIKDWKREETQ